MGRHRYRAARSKSSTNNRALFIMNALFLVFFTAYQVMLSRSNGGREAVQATYRSFLKGGGSVRKDATDVVEKGDTGDFGKDQPGTQAAAEEKQSIEERKTEPLEIEKENDPLPEENGVKLPRRNNPFTKENEVMLPRENHDPFTEENEVKLPLRNDPFTEENEVKLLVFNDPLTEENEVKLPVFNDPFTEENEVKLPLFKDPFTEENEVKLPLFKDPFTEENEVDFPVFNDPFTEENEVKLPLLNDPFTEENEVKLPAFNDPFTEENEVKSPVFNDPFTKENEVKLPVFNDPFTEENEVKVEVHNNPFSKENEEKFQQESGEEEFAPFVIEAGEKGSPIQGAAEPSYEFDPNRQLFHSYYRGKSGKVVEEMLMAHAYIFHEKATYGGCCGTASSKTAAHVELLDALGLKDVLLFKCPRDFVQDTTTRRSVLSREKFLSQDTRAWTPEYVDYLRSMVKIPKRRHKDYTIVVHMLRGNTSPCKEKNRGFHSYLPNLHYQNLINKYMRPGARVIIYSSVKSFESLNEFRNRGYEVNTDSSLKEMWQEFVSADVFIMSRSDFSMVPAMVAKGVVIYTPFWHHSVRRWKRASTSIMNQTDEETQRLRERKCISPYG